MNIVVPIGLFAGILLVLGLVGYVFYASGTGASSLGTSYNIPALSSAGAGLEQIGIGLILLFVSIVVIAVVIILRR